MDGVYDLALRYYKSGAWSKEMIDALYKKNKITQREYKKILAERNLE